MTQPLLDGVHHLKVPASNLSRSLDWYEKLFGVARLAEFDHIGRSGRVYAHILDVPGVGLFEVREAPITAGNMSGFDPVTYAVKDRRDLAAWAEHLDNLGIENSGEIRGGIGWLLVFCDPDGMAIRIYTRQQHELDIAGADTDSHWLRLAPDSSIVDSDVPPADG
ncbi:VOC family protein [Rhodococcoides yunnanense]|uniref:VOC family protein n=1 Tax=Rhodococcoides yunnanense TaxID=278209 RepID=UPI000933D95B|nr:VOC family protein [Rhodococcus yunnanensis]